MNKLKPAITKDAPVWESEGHPFINEKRIEHDYTSNPVCPYCGYENPDGWELDDSGIYECCVCEKEYQCDRNISCTYSTSKIEDQS